MTDDEDVQSIARDLAHRYPDMCAADFERAEQIIFSNPPPEDRPRSHKMSDSSQMSGGMTSFGSPNALDRFVAKFSSNMTMLIRAMAVATTSMRSIMVAR
jgi:hypothetical protein